MKILHVINVNRTLVVFSLMMTHVREAYGFSKEITTIDKICLFYYKTLAGSSANGLTLSIEPVLRLQRLPIHDSI